VKNVFMTGFSSVLAFLLGCLWTQYWLLGNQTNVKIVCNVGKGSEKSTDVEPVDSLGNQLHMDYVLGPSENTGTQVLEDDYANDNLTNYLTELEKAETSIGIKPQILYINLRGENPILYVKTMRELGIRLVYESKFPSPKALASFKGTGVFCNGLPAACKPQVLREKLPRYVQHGNLMSYYSVLFVMDKARFDKVLVDGIQGDSEMSKFLFKSWTFPANRAKAIEYSQNNPESKFIVKPVKGTKGEGISIVEGSKLKNIARNVLVQEYMEKPLLIHGKKWDIRMYVIVASLNPLRVYLSDDGLIRFAATKYSGSTRRSAFLTNTHVSRNSANQTRSSNVWGFKHMENVIGTEKWNTLFESLRKAVGILFQSAEIYWLDHGTGIRSHHIFGVDAICSEEYTCKLIEANSRPDMIISKRTRDEYSLAKVATMTGFLSTTFLKNGSSVKKLRTLLDGFKGDLNKLKKSDWLYLIQYISEAPNRGGLASVYPNPNFLATQRRFVEMHKARFPESRLVLHDVLAHIEPQLEAEQVSELASVELDLETGENDDQFNENGSPDAKNITQISPEQ